MGAVLHQATPINNENLRRVGHACQAMRDDEHRVVARELLDHLSDRALALGVHVGCGLVEDEHRGFAKQCPSHARALALAAGQVLTALGHLHIQPAGRPHESVDPAAREHAPELVVGRERAREQEVAPQRALKEVPGAGNERHRAHERVQRGIANVDAADRERAAIRRLAPREDTGERALAAAARAHDGRQAPPRNRGIHALEHHVVPVRVAHAGAHHVARAIELGAPALRHRRVQDAEHRLRRAHAVHGRVEERTQTAHGQEELLGEKHHGKGPGKADGAHRKLPHGEDDARRRAAERHQVHDGDGGELHAEHLHRGQTEALGPLVHAFVPAGVRLVDLERGEPLHRLEEAAAQVNIGIPVLPRHALRPAHHHHDGRGDERHHHHEDRRGQRGQTDQADEEHHGGDDRVEELGQVPAKVDLELLSALDARLHRLGRGDAFRVRGAELGQLIVHTLANGPLCQVGGAIARALGQVDGDGAHEDGSRKRRQVPRAAGRHGHGDRGVDGRAVRPGNERNRAHGADEPAQGQDDEHVHEQGDDLGDHGCDDIGHHAGHELHKPLIEHAENLRGAQRGPLVRQGYFCFIHTTRQGRR